jgi:hypothetical protein
MPMLVQPRLAVSDVLDVLGEVLAAASLVAVDAVAWAHGPVPKPRLQLVPDTDTDPDPNLGSRPRATKPNRI